MKRFACITLFLLCLMAMPALADTDYICLKACIGNGGASGTCLKKCDYDPLSLTSDSPHADSKCLKQCRSHGGASTTCIPQCTDISSPHLPNSAVPRASVATHNQFKAPVPSDKLLLSSHVSPKQVSVDTDYNCLHQCIHEGMQYPLCNQRCVK